MTPAATSGPSRRTIATATAIAFTGAVVILTTVVLPAEYGVDPLGTGRALGLLDLYGAQESLGPAIAPAGDGPLRVQGGRFRADSRQLVIPSLGTVEFKYELRQGAALLYAWTATGPVGFDFHTEPAGRPANASESFERDEADARQGSYTAPYDGLHGWYWENLTDGDVTITLETVGFYAEAMLFLPNRAPQRLSLAQ